MPVKTEEKERVEVKELTDQITAEFKKTYGELNKKTSDLSEIVKELKSKVQEKADVTDLEGRLKDIQQDVINVSTLADELDKKMARPTLGALSSKSLGEQFVESDSFKTFSETQHGKAFFETKSILSSDMAVGSQTRYVGIDPTRAPMVMLPDQPLTIRDLLPVGRTTSNSVEYDRETSFTNNAAPTAEGAAKPESSYGVTLENAPVRTIAHYFRLSKQVLDDSAMLSSHIDMRLRYGLALEEQEQILTGDGTGVNLHGLVPQASTFPASVATSGIPGGVDATQVDVLRWAKLQVTNRYYPGSVVVLNPEDWAAIELLKDQQGGYLYSAFTSGAEPRLWGMRVVESPSIAAGTFLLGAAQMGAAIWDREKANVIVSTEDADNITKNMVTIRGEERIALTVFRPDAFETGSFTLAA